MSIRQERMITLINAAMAYRELAYYANTLLSNLTKSHALTQTELANDITAARAQLEFALIEAARHDESISGERDAFARNQSRNERARIKMTEKRRAAGIGPRKHIERLNEMNRIAHTGAERGDHYISTSPDLDPAQRAEIDKFIANEPTPEETILEEELREIEEARAARLRPRQPLFTEPNLEEEE